MDDLIRRKDAVDAIAELRNAVVEQYGKVPCKGYWELTAAKEVVNSVPVVQKWVSVKKGLPEEGCYLVTVDVYGERYVVETYFHKDRWMTNDRVVAWMPRPEPWGGEE